VYVCTFEPCIYIDFRVLASLQAPYCFQDSNKLSELLLFLLLLLFVSAQINKN
jgi:hypothetical protein